MRLIQREEAYQCEAMRTNANTLSHMHTHGAQTHTLHPQSLSYTFSRLFSPSKRYLSHFRSVHRGAYFAELRTTTVRKLLPESWGFMCPVHTPDGSPCGLLNHFTAACQIITHGPEEPSETENMLVQVGVEGV